MGINGCLSARSRASQCPPELHAVELDAKEGLVGLLLRQLGRFAQSRHAQNTATAGHGLPIDFLCAGMEDHGVVGVRRETSDDVALCGSRGSRQRPSPRPAQSGGPIAASIWSSVPSAASCTSIRSLLRRIRMGWVSGRPCGQLNSRVLRCPGRQSSGRHRGSR